jgi:hypothetical protein
MANKTNYQGYFFAILAQSMDDYLKSLGPNSYRQKVSLAEQLHRIVVEKQDPQRTADAVIRFMVKGRASKTARNYLSLARRLATNKEKREFFRQIEDEGEENFLRLAASRAFNALGLQYMQGSVDSIFESFVEEPNFVLKEAVGPKDGIALKEAAEPKEAVTPGPAAEAEPRFLNARTREQVRPNDEFGLTVQVTTTLENHGPAEQGTSIPEIQGDIIINVDATGVAFLDSSIQTLHVPPKGASAPILFRLKAIQPGEHEIRITAWNGPAHIAGITLITRIDEAPVAAEGMTAQASAVVMRDPVPGEYTLLINYLETEQCYSFLLLGEGLGEGIAAKCKPLTDQRRIQYEGLRTSLSDQTKNKNHYFADQQFLWLKGFGINFANCVVPASIQTALRQIRQKVEQFRIMNDADDLPWELLYIDAPDTGEAAASEGFFLADLAGTSRWRYDAPAPAKIFAIPSILVHPEGSPPYTAEEIRQLQQLFPAAQVIENMGDLLKLIGQDKFGMLHFASHNLEAADYSGGSYVPFGMARFDQNLFTGAVRPNTYRTSRPLIFMNACTTAGGSSLFTETFSWADRYLRSGAGSFIGSLWEISDQSAPVFAVAFYEKLKNGSTLGEAMHAGREAIRNLDAGDPSRLAYTLYGNPLAKVEYV